eukprot:1591325-Amphidinium_carterae.1
MTQLQAFRQFRGQSTKHVSVGKCVTILDASNVGIPVVLRRLRLKFSDASRRCKRSYFGTDTGVSFETFWLARYIVNPLVHATAYAHAVGCAASVLSF